MYIYIWEGWGTNFHMSPSSPYLVAMATEPPSTPEYEENILFACSGGSNSKKIGSYSPN